MTYWREWRAWGPGGGEADDRIISELLESNGGAEPGVWLTTSPDGLLDQVTWRTGDAALRELDRGNEKVDQAYREIEAGYLDAADSLHWYHVLIHPDHEVGPFKREGGGGKPWILFDIQFRNRWSSRMMFIGVSFWVGDPNWIPDEALGRAPRETSAHRRHEWFMRCERQARTHVRAHFRKAKQDIREYEAPEFWIALEDNGTGDRPSLKNARDLYEVVHGGATSGGARKRFPLRRLLGGAGATELSSADVCVEPARRDERTVRECYVVLPDTPHLNGTVVGERLRPAVAGLLTLEALAASGNDIREQLQVWREHAMIYQHAARTAGALWDGVATHLPIRRWWRLNRAHRAVELIHLMLLQGMADLADVASHVDERVSRIERLEHLADERFAETLGWAGRGLREALADASHFTELKRFGSRARDVADRATEQYKNLLESMAHAFDERRVRELEVLQRAGFWLSMTIGAFAVLTFMDFFMEIEHKQVVDDLFMADRRLHVMVWGVLGLLTAIVLGVTAKSLWSQRMGSSWFHRTFRRLERYLRLSSTRELELLRGRITRTRKDTWKGRDQDLADRFADLWDESARAVAANSSARPQPPRRAGRSGGPSGWLDARWVALRGVRWSGRDLATQRRDIEALIVRTLLLAERTPTLRRYGLVRLALLHRHCGRLPGNWFGEFDGVSRSELRMVFTTAGGSAEIADKVDKRMAERIAHTKAVEAGRVDDRAAPAGKIRTARELLEAIEQELVRPDLPGLAA
ncbi:hypothetical protein [Nonomuraea ferruginea]|uniref:Uncharacterized protein n=2 Tax=Nonomuraea ferruginea TaxID=46174 RepID=A0ABT4T1L1_9ACTN|nr:hypothetical protein [Nonomuraea ferruginea]MDA0643159.1 hypothetical protein [Nonomuraea ferruginea]